MLIAITLYQDVMDSVAPIAVGGVVLPVYVTKPMEMDQVGTQIFDHLATSIITRSTLKFQLLIDTTFSQHNLEHNGYLKLSSIDASINKKCLQEVPTKLLIYSNITVTL